MDTQPLTQSQWPSVSTSLQNVFELGRLFGLELRIPQAVLHERQAQWFRGLSDKFRQLENRHRSTIQYCNGFCDVPKLIGPNFKEAKEAYKARVDEVLKQYDIEAPATTLRSAEELYHLSLRCVLPFAEKGTGFKDAVIIFSIIDDLAKDPVGKPAAVVTRDSDFDAQAFQQLSGDLKVDVEIYRSLDEVTAVLNAALEEIMQQSWEADREHAKTALLAKADEIAAFISETVVFQEYELGLLGRSVEIPELHVRLIRDVKTPFPLKRPKDEKVKISCLVEGGLRVVKEVFPAPPPRNIKVGESLDATAPQLGLMGLGIEPRWETHNISKVFELDAQAIFEDGQFCNLEFLNVRRRDDLFSMFDMQKTLAEVYASQQGQSKKS